MYNRQIAIYQLNIVIRQLEDCMCKQARKQLKMKQKIWRKVALKKTSKKIMTTNIVTL